MAQLKLDTPRGEARAHLHPASEPKAALVLGHGAGGTIEAPDLVAATEAANAEGVSVALVEQPYLVAGKKSSPAPHLLDEAWTPAIEQLREEEFEGLPLIAGGRSAGARVACRTAADTGAVAVLCLAFPLQPPARKGKQPGPSRIDELEAVEVSILIVQGERDRFGMPKPARGRDVAQVPGDHSLRKDPEAVADAVRGWLPGAVANAARAAS